MVRLLQVYFPGWLKLRNFAKTAVWFSVTATGLAFVFAAGRCSRAQTPSTPAQQTELSASIRGVVINANTNQPIARALVQSDSQSILTGHDGKFEFDNLPGTVASVKVTKPGFYQGLNPYLAPGLFLPVGSSEELRVRLYPESLLTGTVTAASGDPLQQINVQALRYIDDDSGGHWILGGQSSTNADGQFRLPLPGGEYVLETQYARERAGIRQALLPTIFPASGSNATSSDNPSTIHLLSGEEQHVDLRPPMRPSHAVHIQIDGGAGASPAQSTPRIEAHLANGIAFSPGTRGSEKSGEVVVDLPSGTYTVSATVGVRDNDASYGETKVTVAGEDVSGVVIHLQQATELTIEASVDHSAATSTPSLTDTALVRQLGLFLQKTRTGVSLGSGNISPTSRPGGQFSFSLQPGTYRLRTTAYNAWFIESATAGDTDLLTQDLAIDGGSSSLPLRLVVSNQTATIKGTVKLAGTGASASYVYLIAEASSALPIISARTGQDGSFSRAMVPPGSYRVLASEAPPYFDLNRPATQTRLATYLKTVTVASGETGSVDLNAVPAAEWKP